MRVLYTSSGSQLSRLGLRKPHGQLRQQGKPEQLGRIGGVQASGAR
jgi:hypothetical protein